MFGTTPERRAEGLQAAELAESPLGSWDRRGTYGRRSTTASVDAHGASGEEGMNPNPKLLAALHVKRG
jgi:hypothetical protein